MSARKNDVRPIFVFDWKGLIRWPGFVRYTRLKEFINRQGSNRKQLKSVYAPSIEENNKANFWETFFKFCYLRGNCQIYVDEVYAITSGDDIPDWYHACLTRGRERGISVYSASQRPVKIPQVILSESEHNFVFRLQMKQDRAKIESTIGLDAAQILSLSKRYFFYANAEGDVRGPFTLNIKKKGANKL